MSACGLYVFDESGRIRPERDVLKWAKFFGDSKTLVVKQDTLNGVAVSTVFLGIDHDFSRRGVPVLWETMTFSPTPDFNNRTWRCAGNLEQAQAQHERVLGLVRKAQQSPLKKP